ncbi:intradiol ring-cleavage dioxygenase [Thiothrix nivea]|uniref:Intradiol ring-cleavage dioxygenase n=1 Tax=Thiothrix nivea (strain ATCC 35100 / DSM 5205 / JP2) TaxID=870187 RepID=A0A656HBE0_THINJ|nr:intradiol ring-cleavage dioxygenase [Thiothrix nivea]EIJ33623.1 intradiol ring-cleavage dioxygenase [Thiothrix nivea DSM 5205]
MMEKKSALAERRHILKILGGGILLGNPWLSSAWGNTAISAAATTGTKWASGNTSLITVPYPDDSIFDSGNTCNIALTQATTEGPCYFGVETGEDISSGLSGLPMQLCLKLVDSDCQPLENHWIEVWHCDNRGVYSGNTRESFDSSRFAGGFCTSNDSAAQASTWYRGILQTDSKGRVNFKTCFPGWYRGRTIHIHFAVRERSGHARVISQFCFTDALAKEICTTHEHYSSRGEQDTTLAGGRDGVFPRSGYESFMLTTAQNADGTLLAYHTIKIA